MGQRVEDDVSVGAVFSRALRHILALTQTEEVPAAPALDLVMGGTETPGSVQLFRALQLNVLPEVLGSNTGAVLYLAAKRFSRTLGLQSLQALKTWFRDVDLGELEVELDEEKVLVKLNHCMTCHRLPAAGVALCDFERGLIDGVLEILTGSEVLSKETLCWGLGDTVCQFEAYAEEMGGYLYREHGVHSEVQQRLLAGIADQAELAVETMRLVGERRSLETRDQLTGLYNFRHLKEHAVLELARAARYSRRATVVMIDVDDFSEVNRRVGREAADVLLRHCAERLRAELRAVDLVCRYGADEFLLVLPETSENQADMALKRVLAGLGDVGCEVDGETIAISVSAGAAVYPDDGERIEELVAKATTTMYAVRAGGRGGVSFYGSGTR